VAAHSLLLTLLSLHRRCHLQSRAHLAFLIRFGVGGIDIGDNDSNIAENWVLPNLVATALSIDSEP
jgi:hypothetical protein